MSSCGVFSVDIIRKHALCHRDYIIPSGDVAVAMYNDHLEITNPGALHFGINSEKLTKSHEYRP